MKTLWILAAAATFAACHNRSSDETGAAPDRGDSTMTTIDTTKTDTTMAPNPSASGYDTTTAAPTVPSDSTANPPAPESGIDTTSTTNSQNPPSGQTYDTTSTSVPSPSADSTAPAAPSTGVDTTTNPSGSMTDSTMAAPMDSSTSK